VWLPAKRRKFIVIRPLPAMGLALGIKRIETRPFAPGGPHSPTPGQGQPGCGLDPGEDLTIVMKRQRPTRRDLALWAELAGDIDPRPTADDWPLGHAVAVVRYAKAVSIKRVVDPRPDPDNGIVQFDEWGEAHDDGRMNFWAMTPTEWLLGEGWGEDRWGWLTYLPRRLETPVPVAGQQGIQYMTEAETDAVQEQLDRMPF
jgi:hypothetical protein